MLDKRLPDCHQVTIMNGCKSESMAVGYGEPQESGFGPIPFSIFCNDLPEVVDEEGQIEMYVDYTTLCVAARTQDEVAE